MLFSTLRPAGRETRARKYKKLYGNYTMMEPAVCVSLLGSATRLAVIACSWNRPRWHITPRPQADVTVGSLPWRQFR